MSITPPSSAAARRPGLTGFHFLSTPTNLWALPARPTASDQEQVVDQLLRNRGHTGVLDIQASRVGARALRRGPLPRPDLSPHLADEPRSSRRPAAAPVPLRPAPWSATWTWPTTRWTRPWSKPEIHGHLASPPPNAGCRPPACSLHSLSIGSRTALYSRFGREFVPPSGTYLTTRDRRNAKKAKSQ